MPPSDPKSRADALAGRAGRRLAGRRLSLLRAVGDTPVGRRLLWSRVRKHYALDALMSLPADAVEHEESEPRPIAGAAPRQWGDRALPAPPGACAALHRAWAEGEGKPSELLDAIAAFLERGDFGEALHSPFQALDLDAARAAARDSDRRHAQGRPLGPLDGIPLPLKDQLDMRGLANTAGTTYRRQPAERDASHVATLRAGGALLYGRTRTTEWGMNPLGHSPHVAMPRNLRDRERVPGGSSTGAAVAVGLGLAPVAGGSDGGGSIRIPAALQGVFGLKPTFGLLGRSGDLFGSGSMASLGALAGSTADLAAFLEVAAAAADPADPATAWHPDRAAAVSSWRRALGRGIAGARIGIPEGEWRDADPGVQQACQAAVRALQAEGAKIVDLRIPQLEHAATIGVVTIGSETLAGLEAELAAHGDAMGDELRLQLSMLACLGTREHRQAARARATLRRRLARIIAGVDLLALPTTPIPAPPWPAPEGRGVPVSDDPATRAVGRYAFLANLAGLPAGTVPIGLVEGLPVGLQLVADAWDEASLLAGMAACERLGLARLDPPPGPRLAPSTGPSSAQ